MRPARWFRGAGALALALIALVVLLAFVRFHDERTGWTYLLDFGATLPVQRLPEVGSLPIYWFEQVPGYDAQSYAQIALRPSVQDPALLEAVDNLLYRGRRILLPWLAALVGQEDPWRTLNAYALLNLVAWCGLGVLLLRWTDVGRVDGILRWCGVMLSAGMLGSLRHALTDGPALLAIAGAAALSQARRPWLAAAVGGIGGMIRETSVLVATAFVPQNLRSFNQWGRAVGQMAVVVLPIALWMVYLRWIWADRMLTGDNDGLGNFVWPFVAFGQRWYELILVLKGADDAPWVWYALLNHLGLTVQAIFLVCAPKWRDPVWRVGAAHVVLLSVLNTPVWEGYPGAAARVLLPLTFAFNVLAPRGRLGLLLLVVGNLGIVAGMHELRPPAEDVWRVIGTEQSSGQSKRENPRRTLFVRFDDHVYGAETHRAHTWRWTNGDTVMTIYNAADNGWRVRLRLGLRAVEAREVTLEGDGRVLWRGSVATELVPVDAGELVVPPGGLALRFRVGEPSGPLATDARRLAVAIYDVVVEVLGTADASP